MRHEFFHDEQGEPRLWWSTQNISGDWYGHGPSLPIWREGRAWLNATRRWVRSGRQRAVSLGAEWHLGMNWRRFSLSFTVHSHGDEDDLSVHVALPGLALYLSAEDVLPERARPKRGGELALKVMEGQLWLYPWVDPGEWRSLVPWWRKTHIFDPVRLLFGPARYSEEGAETVDGLVSLPEGTYPVTVRLFTSVWQRRRLLPAKRLRRAEISVLDGADGIPFPGKGENSWDQDEDAVYSLTCPALDLPGAIGAMTAHVLRNRERYGGKNWRPREHATA